MASRIGSRHHASRITHPPCLRCYVLRTPVQCTPVPFCIVLHQDKTSFLSSIKNQQRSVIQIYLFHQYVFEINGSSGSGYGLPPPKPTRRILWRKRTIRLFPVPHLARKTRRMPSLHAARIYAFPRIFLPIPRFIGWQSDILCAVYHRWEYHLIIRELLSCRSQDSSCENASSFSEDCHLALYW